MITVGASHGYVVNNTVYVSGVAGMTEINGRRGLITAIGGSTITVNINSTAYTTYTSGGQVNASLRRARAYVLGASLTYRADSKQICQVIPIQTFSLSA